DWLGYTLKRKLANRGNPLTQKSEGFYMDQRKKYPIPYLTRLQEWDIQTKQTTRPSVTDSHCI
ncbi:hypothetical protein, partial [Bacteroides stercoris]|uniref:hypothetical protein n=1 Tax=Bacteroides stercoris TaxID=46506 RepID=UPI001C70FDEE